MTRRKYGAELDAARSRPVQACVSEPEHAAAHASGESVTEQIRAVIERMECAVLEPAGDMASRRYLSARLSQAEIEALTAASQACGLEPTVLLRLAVTARLRTGTGEALWRVLGAVRRR